MSVPFFSIRHVLMKVCYLNIYIYIYIYIYSTMISIWPVYSNTSGELLINHLKRAYF